MIIYSLISALTNCRQYSLEPSTTTISTPTRILDKKIKTFHSLKANNSINCQKEVSTHSIPHKTVPEKSIAILEDTLNGEPIKGIGSIGQQKNALCRSKTYIKAEKMFNINVEVAEITAYNIISKADDPFSVVKLIENTKEVLV